MLEVRDLHAYYGDSHVLHGIDLTVGEGEVVAMVGRNGMGKTTTIHSILGVVAARKGKIAINGRPLETLKPHQIARAGLALVPEGRQLFSTLTVHENLEMGAFARGDRDGFAARVDRMFAMFPRLKERHAQIAGSLSGGEQQMLAIGRALMGNPRVLLMDEPSEGLAPQIVAEVRRTIEQLKAEGLSIVLVEQNIKLTLDLADDIVIINTGRLAFAGAASEIKIDSPIVAQQLGVF